MNIETLKTRDTDFALNTELAYKRQVIETMQRKINELVWAYQELKKRVDSMEGK